jgi:hypothetical protein
MVIKLLYGVIIMVLEVDAGALIQGGSQFHLSGFYYV